MPGLAQLPGVHWWESSRNRGDGLARPTQAGAESLHIRSHLVSVATPPVSPCTNDLECRKKMGLFLQL